MRAFHGVGPLIRFALRRDRIFLPVWILAIVAITYASTAAVRRTYDTPREIASYAINIGESPASVAMNGPAVSLNEIGGILVYETSLTALLGVALMAVFTVVRHTRKEEDEGRVELLGSTVVSRHAVTTAGLAVAVAASVLVGAGVAFSFLVEDQPTTVSLLYGAAVAAMGVVFAGVAACAAQLMSHGRGAVGLSLAFLGVAFGLRAIGDVNESFWSWLSPMGWSQQVRLYDDNRWWPLALSLVLAVLFIVATAVFETRRDLGAGIVPPRPGPANAGRSLGSVVGLSWRLQRGSIIGWVAGIFVMGLLFGSFTESIQGMIEDNPTFAEYFEQTGAASIVDSYLATAMLMLAIGASGFALASALRMRGEESAGRIEQLLTTSVSRTRWLFGSLLVTLGGTVLVMGFAGLGVGVSYTMTGGSPSEMWRMTGASLVYLPAILVLAAFAVLLVGWVPRASAAAWAGLALVFVVGWLGSVLDLPKWVTELSPFTHTPTAPAADVTVAPLAVMLSITALAVAAGWVGFRRRDIG